MKQASLLVVLVSIVTTTAQPPPSDLTCFQANKVHTHDCCPFPRFIDQAINDKCEEEFKASPRPPPGVQAHEGSCVMECKLTATGIFADGKLILDKATQVLGKTVGADKNFEPLLRGALEECHVVVTSNPAYSVKPVAAVPGRAGCSFIPQGFFNCVKKKLFLSCPAGHWTGADGCDQLKQKLSGGCSYLSVSVGVKPASG